MSLLSLYDPPARMSDFDAISGQRWRGISFSSSSSGHRSKGSPRLSDSRSPHSFTTPANTILAGRSSNKPLSGTRSRKNCFGASGGRARSLRLTGSGRSRPMRMIGSTIPTIRADLRGRGRRRRTRGPNCLSANRRILRVARRSRSRQRPHRARIVNVGAARILACDGGRATERGSVPCRLSWR